MPSLELPALGGSDAVDSSALVFLVCRAVEDRKKEEEKVKVEVRMERIEDMMCEGAPVSSADMAAWRRWATKDCPSSSVSIKRKKRKRREKKLPRGRPLRLGRAHRLSPGRGGLVCSWVLRSGEKCDMRWWCVGHRCSSRVHHSSCGCSVRQQLPSPPSTKVISPFSSFESHHVFLYVAVTPGRNTLHVGAVSYFADSFTGLTHDLNALNSVVKKEFARDIMNGS